MSPPPSSDLRRLPSVDRALREIGETGLPRPLVVAVIREELSAARESPSEVGSLMQRIRVAIEALRTTRIQPLINATGVIVHTNFGRAPLASEAVRAMIGVAENYNSLEYDLAGGDRGSRGQYVETCLSLLCAAEAATVVNNCAAALVLILRHFAAAPPRTHVIISRGELVQIGGGFRVPEILEASGATLREVGTTNMTTADDYRRAIDDRTAMILKVHRGNFHMEGFVQSPPVTEIALLAREAGLPLVEDLGSGATFDTAALGGNEREPTPGESLARGSDLVCFSGDKLLGGPQAGIIVGRASHVAALKREPFFRALRCDKLILTALQSTVELLLDGRDQDVPIRSMMQTPLVDLTARAERIITALAGLPTQASVGSGAAQVGGGSLPRTVIPSVTVELRPERITVDRLAERLRGSSPPVIGVIAGGAFTLDLRTVFPSQDEQVARALVAALAPVPEDSV